MKQIAIYIAAFLIVCACTSRGRYTAMRHALDSINTLNRTDRPFTPADVEPYIGYFDRHGNSNDRMLAHYLLGRAYHEQGEAPMALRCYQEAVTAADTTDEECDYAQLSRVYAQMGGIFYGQNMMGQQLACMKTAKTYAWKGNDTLAALMCYEQMSLAHERKNHLDSALLIAEDVSHLYEQYGYPSDAAIALGSVIEILIKKGNTAKAKEYLMEYESKSGYFDTLGNIMPGREIYYKTKGLYYLYTYKLDSARLYFEKELAEGKDFNNQNAGAYGLAMYYDKVNKPDSASKYYRYAYIMNDSMYGRMEAEVIERMNALYNYTRFQGIAYAETEKASKRTRIIWICIAIILVLTLFVVSTTLYLIQKRKEAEQRYLQCLELIRQARNDLKQLNLFKEINKKLIIEKENTIARQLTTQKEILEDNTHIRRVANRSLRMTDIYCLFETMSIKGKLPTNADWEKLEETIFTLYPGFMQFLMKYRHLLNEKEFKTCLLIRINFKPKAISSMLDVSPSYISIMRIEMLKKLFNEQGKAKEFDALIQDIY